MEGLSRAATVFLRIVVRRFLQSRGQYWDVDGRNVGVAGFGGTIGDLTNNWFSAVNGDLSIKFLGLALATGLTW